MLLVIVISAVIGYIVFSDKTENNLPKNNVSQAVDLGFTVEEFKKAYNKNAVEKNLPQMKITNFEFGTSDSSNTFGYKFVDTFYLWGKVNPETRKITSISVTKALVLRGSDRKAEMQAAASAFLIMVKTLSPELTSNERAAILNKFSESGKPYTEVTEGNIKYSQAIMDNDKILMLSADPKDTKK